MKRYANDSDGHQQLKYYVWHPVTWSFSKITLRPKKVNTFVCFSFYRYIDYSGTRTERRVTGHVVSYNDYHWVHVDSLTPWMLCLYSGFQLIILWFICYFWIEICITSSPLSHIDTLWTQIQQECLSELSHVDIMWSLIMWDVCQFCYILTWYEA